MAKKAATKKETSTTKPASKKKPVKKVTPKKQKEDIKASNVKLKSGEGFEMSFGIPATEYRILPKKNDAAFWQAVLATEGFAKGKIYEVAGKSDVGKSAICANWVGQFQSLGEKGFLVDGERAMSQDFAKTIGLDSEKLMLARPEYGEAGFFALKQILTQYGGEVGYLDSTASMKPKAQVQEDKKDMASGARLASDKMPVIETLVHQQKATLFLISQIKEKPGVTFGNPEYIAGGAAYGYHSRVRMTVSSVAAEKDKKTGQREGYTFRIKVTKNHTGPKRTRPFDMLVDNLFRPRWTETAVAWALSFGLVDETNKTICGIPFSGAITKKNLGKAIAGQESLVFESAHALMQAEENKTPVNDYETQKDTSIGSEAEVADESGNSGGFNTIDILDDEVDDDMQDGAS